MIKNLAITPLAQSLRYPDAPSRERPLQPENDSPYDYAFGHE